MFKRPPPSDADLIAPSSKKPRTEAETLYNKIATVKNAAAVDKDPPLAKLLKAMKNCLNSLEKGDAVVYWMRMEDMRSE